MSTRMAKPGQGRRSATVYSEGSKGTLRIPRFDHHHRKRLADMMCIDPSIQSYSSTNHSRGSVSPSSKKPIVHQQPGEKVYDTRRDSKCYEDKWK